jgi:hypothetical protein
MPREPHIMPDSWFCTSTTCICWPTNRAPVSRLLQLSSLESLRAAALCPKYHGVTQHRHDVTATDTREQEQSEARRKPAAHAESAAL